jgi:hypothetical protein
MEAGREERRAVGVATGERPAPPALAEAVQGAVRNTNRVADDALARGVAVLVPCACAVDVGRDRCLRGLSLPLPGRWMRAARTRRVAGRSVGRLPRRTCILCRSRDHDLAPTHDVAVSVVGHGDIGPIRVALPRRSSATVTQARAIRAGALPPVAVEEQKKAAGVR